jgi:hypothetical protein
MRLSIRILHVFDPSPNFHLILFRLSESTLQDHDICRFGIVLRRLFRLAMKVYQNLTSGYATIDLRILSHASSCRSLYRVSRYS